MKRFNCKMQIALFSGIFLIFSASDQNIEQNYIGFETTKKLQQFLSYHNTNFAFVGHQKPESSELIEMIHQRGTLCIMGTSRNLDFLSINNSA